MEITINLERYQAIVTAQKLAEIIRELDNAGKLNQMQWDGLTTLRDALNGAITTNKI